MTRITLHHLVGRLEAGTGDLRDGQLLMVGFLCRDDWSIGGQGEVDTWVRHQVCLELCQIDVESPIKPQGRSDGADDLANQPVGVITCVLLYIQHI